MTQESQAKKRRLAQLRQELERLKTTLPEHCSGRDRYTDAHHASVEHWQKIEETEEQIKVLEAQLVDVPDR
jgi:predicted RNase H-like nuclease (RuvC/YqgF family)